MARPVGATLLHAVSQRIISRYLESAGYAEVSILPAPKNGGSTVVDLTYKSQGRRLRAKVKSDAYFGNDPAKVQDRGLVFYRGDAGHYAFESISNNMTREPGWMFNSDADELLYFYIVIAQPEEEVAALLEEPDDVFFSELKVDRDELRILPMKETREWFEAHYEEYTPRPVKSGDHSAWYRLIPRADIDTQVSGIRIVGSLFSSLAI